MTRRDRKVTAIVALGIAGTVCWLAVARIGFAEIPLRLSLDDAEPGGRNPDGGDIGGAARSLAVAAMTLE